MLRDFNSKPSLGNLFLLSSLCAQECHLLRVLDTALSKILLSVEQFSFAFSSTEVFHEIGCMA
jgi:hypothetical protein